LTIIEVYTKSYSFYYEIKRTKEPHYLKIWKRILANEEIAVKKQGQDTEKFNKFLTEGKLAMIELDYNVILIKSLYCKQFPLIRWHISPLDLFQVMPVLGFRNGLDKKIIDSINKV